MLSQRLLLLALTAAAAGAQPYDFAAASAYSAAHNGHALLVAIDGVVMHESFANNWNPATPHTLASGTKSFNGTLLMMAIRDGLITSINERVALALTEWQADARKSQITYRQLLGLTSGLDAGTVGNVPTYAAAIQQAALAAPDQVFDYGPAPFQAFGAALERKLAPTQRTVAQYLQDNLLTPLNLAVGLWTNFNTGRPNLPSGAYLVAREWWKYGEFIRLGGVVGQTRLLPQAAIDRCFVPGPVNGAYGITWWLNAAPLDGVAAQGAGQQRLYVIRPLKMVIVRFGDQSATWNDNAFFNQLMPAAAESYGSGCLGTSGTPSLTSVNRPQLGTSFRMQASALPANALGALYLGVSREQFGALSLPLDLSPLGMTRCALLASPDLSVPLQANGAGLANWAFPLPFLVDWFGQPLYWQSFVSDPGANPLGLTASNGLAIRLGAR